MTTPVTSKMPDTTDCDKRRQNPGCACESSLDQKRLAELKELGGDDDPEWFTGVVQRFIDDTRDRLDELSAALAAGDGNALKVLAHTLKGSCRTIGAGGMADLCRSIELAAADGSAEVAGQIYEKLVASFSVTRGELEEVLRQTPKAG